MNILGWSDWRIVSIEDRGPEYLIEAERSIIPTTCIHCGSDQVHRHGNKRQFFLDTPAHGKRCAILVHRRRFQCQNCHRSFFGFSGRDSGKNPLAWRSSSSSTKGHARANRRNKMVAAARGKDQARAAAVCISMQRRLNSSLNI